MNYWAERYRSAFDLLFSRLPHEYAPRSADESFCCWSSTPYLDIIALIRRYQSQETDVDGLENAATISLMTCLSSVRADCEFTAIAPASCRFTSIAVRFPLL